MKIKIPNIRLPSMPRLKISPGAIQELALLVGFLMLLRGLWMVYEPAMWIVGGLYLMLPAGKR